MKNSTVSVTGRQLRSIIAEVAAEQAAAPETDIYAFVDGIMNSWRAQFSAEDPVQGYHGEDDWERQVQKAGMMLQTEIDQLMTTIEAQLHSGEFS